MGNVNGSHIIKACSLLLVVPQNCMQLILFVVQEDLVFSLWQVFIWLPCFQVKLSIGGREFYLVIIARRSRHYAGTRFVLCWIWVSYTIKATICPTYLYLCSSALDAFFMLMVCYDFFWASNLAKVSKLYLYFLSMHYELLKMYIKGDLLPRCFPRYIYLVQISKKRSEWKG